MIRVFVKPLQSPGIFSMLPVKISAKPIFFCWPVLSWMPRSSMIWASENMTAWKTSWLILISKTKMFTSSLSVAVSCLRRKPIMPASAKKFNDYSSSSQPAKPLIRCTIPSTIALKTANIINKNINPARPLTMSSISMLPV